MFGILRMAPLPVIFVLVYTITSVSVYSWAVYRGDVDPLFPYLSSTGDHRPQSCVFSVGNNLCSALVFCIIVFRYHHLVIKLSSDEIESMPARINRLSRFVGYAAAFGMFMVANVQDTAIIDLHMFSAFLTFGAGSIYMCLQAYVTYQLRPFESNKLAIFRSIIAAFSCITFLAAIIFGAIAAKTFHSFYPNLPTPRPWSRKVWQPGFEYHVISGFCEWVVAICHMVYILSFSPKFEDLIVEVNVASEELLPDHQPRQYVFLY